MWILGERMRKYQAFGKTSISTYHLLVSSFIYVLQHKIKSTWLENLRKNHTQKIVLDLKNKLAHQGLSEGTSIEVERRTDLTEEEFVTNYLSKNVPVIFHQAALTWKCTSKWNLDFLQSKYGNETFNIIQTEGLTETSAGKSVKVDDYVRDIKNDTSNEYLRFCPIVESDEKLLEDLDMKWLQKMRKCFLGVSYQTFIGAAGKRTPLHSETLAFFSVMVDGSKRWTLYPSSTFPLFNPVPSGKGYHYSKINLNRPENSTHPGVNLLHRFTCDLQKGDILFVPAWMWHEVENLTTSWGLSCQFTNLYGLITQPTLTFVRCFLTQPSFLAIAYQSYFRKDVRKNKYLLTPKIRLRG